MLKFFKPFAEPVIYSTNNYAWATKFDAKNGKQQTRQRFNSFSALIFRPAIPNLLR